MAGSSGQQQVSLELTEAQKQLVEDEASQSLEQQEQIKIKGSNQRHMIMQKLMRKKAEVRHEIYSRESDWVKNGSKCL